MAQDIGDEEAKSACSYRKEVSYKYMYIGIVAESAREYIGAQPRPAGVLPLRYRARAGSFPHIVLVTAEGWCSDITLHYI